MINIIEGRPGQGKTVYGVHLIQDNIRKKGTFVASNIELSPDKFGDNAKYFKQLSLDHTIEDIMALDLNKIYGELECKRIYVVIDEVQTIMNSREWEKMDPKFQFFLQQHRHYKFDIVGLTQSIKRADVVMRELVQYFFRIYKIFVLPIPFTGNKKKGIRPQAVGLFWRFEYDPDSIESQGRKYERVDALRMGVPILVTPETFDLYDTYQEFPDTFIDGAIEIVKYAIRPFTQNKRVVLERHTVRPADSSSQPEGQEHESAAKT